MGESRLQLAIPFLALLAAGAAGCSSSGSSGGASATGNDAAAPYDATAGTDAPSSDDGAALADGTSAADTGGGPADAGPCDAEVFDSNCGQPCDQGNVLGVGKFCITSADCPSTSMAVICSSFGDPSTHFCTLACTPVDAGPDADGPCGEGAECRCNSSNMCGCVPSGC